MTDNIKLLKPRVIKNKNNFTSEVINKFTKAVTEKEIIGVASVVIYKDGRDIYISKHSTTSGATTALITGIELLKLDIINNWINSA